MKSHNLRMKPFTCPTQSFTINNTSFQSHNLKSAFGSEHCQPCVSDTMPAQRCGDTKIYLSRHNRISPTLSCTCSGKYIHCNTSSTTGSTISYKTEQTDIDRVELQSCSTTIDLNMPKMLQYPSFLLIWLSMRTRLKYIKWIFRS